EANAQRDLNNANQVLTDKQARLTQLIQVPGGEINVKDTRLQGMQQSLQARNNADQLLVNVRAQLTAAQQLPPDQQPDAQQMQLLRDAVNNADAALRHLLATDANLDAAQHPNLQQEITHLTGELVQLRQEAQNLPGEIQTLQDPNPATQGSIAKFTADLTQAGVDLALARGAKDKAEATGALGKATKVEGSQKAYSIGQLTQKTGVVTATGVKMGADAVNVVHDGAKLAGSLGNFVSSAGVVSTGVSALSLPLDCYSLHRDRLAIQGAKSTMKLVKRAEQNALLPLDGTEKSFMKMMKRKLPIADKQFSAAYNSTKIIAGLGSATAVGFKIAILAGCSAGAVAAGAACLTPIGWALAGVAAATLIGYGIFKLSRFIHSKQQQKAYLETVRSNNPLTTPKGEKILGKMADDYIALHPTPANTTQAAYRTQVIQALTGTQGIEAAVQERAEQGLISRSRGYGVEIMTDRLRQEPNPPGDGRTHQLLTALGVKPEDLKKIVDSDKIDDARKLLGKRLRVS
ncbi:MAG: hypothetical protein JO331_09030, partial [Verrucomicrobia bacterium]|nr:hypothetical protein [Verrucomicrobiota bacterium]